MLKRVESRHALWLGALSLFVGAAVTALAAGRASPLRALPLPFSGALSGGLAVAQPVCVPPAGPDVAQPADAPSHVDRFTVAGRRVIAAVPDAGHIPAGARLPVLYFLHGSPGTADDWVGAGAQLPAMLDRMSRLGQLPPVIAVFPDGNGVIDRDSWWGDTALGDTVETWMLHDLVPAIDARYPTLGAAYRGIAGVSSGGFGAMNLALRHPGTFSWVASFSGVFTAPAEIFGAAAAANSPQLTADRLATQERPPLFLGAGADDSEYLPDTQRFVDRMRSLQWAPLHTETVPGGHDWNAWQTEAHDSLRWLGELWRCAG